MAAYRFFDNDSVEWQAILELHWRQTEQCMADQSVVLCLQDDGIGLQRPKGHRLGATEL